jgi:hypothetical protein
VGGRESGDLTGGRSWVDDWSLGWVPGWVHVGVDCGDVGGRFTGRELVTGGLGGSWRGIGSGSLGWGWRRVGTGGLGRPEGWTSTRIDALKGFGAFKGKTS